MTITADVDRRRHGRLSRSRRCACGHSFDRGHRCDPSPAATTRASWSARGQIDGTPVGRVRHRRHPDGRRDGHRGLPATSWRRSTRRCASGYRCSGLWHSGGARLAEGVVALDGVGQVFAAMVRASGRVPQISVVLGPAAGGAAYGPALTDIVIMSGGGRIFVTGPEVVRSVTGEQVDMERLGGPEPHGRRSGVVHVTTKDDETGARVGPHARCHCSDIRAGSAPADTDSDGPGHDLGRADAGRGQPRLRREAGRHRRCSTSPGVELHAKWAPNIVTTLGRFGGRTVGVIANNPLRLGGCLDSSSAERRRGSCGCATRSGVPLVVLVDVPGYLPGLGQEWDGVVRRGAKLLHAFAEAVVPRVTLVTRKAYGGAYIAMNSALARRDRGVRLAERRGGRHGRQRRGQHPAPQEARRGARPRSARSCGRS